MLVAVVGVTVAMRMAVAMSGGWRCIRLSGRDGARLAIVCVVAVTVVVRVGVHSRYNSFYARCGSR